MHRLVAFIPVAEDGEEAIEFNIVPRFATAEKRLRYSQEILVMNALSAALPASAIVYVPPMLARTHPSCSEACPPSTTTRQRATALIA